jgi:membrane protein
VSRRTAFENLGRVLSSLDTLRRLRVRVGHDRLFMRSAALAYETLLSIVPLTAVGMGAVRLFGGEKVQLRLMHYLAEQYLPSTARPAVARVIELVRDLDFHSVGLFGLIALLPVMLSLINAVELALADIFRTPRRAHWFRLLLLGSLLTLAPLGSVLTVRYVGWHSLAYDHVLTPLLLTAFLLFQVFRHLPSAPISDRAAGSGAVMAGVLLALAKAAFGLYATYLASSIHLLWGAIAFVPLLLIWVLLSWCIVLFAAELTAVIDSELSAREHLFPQRRVATSARRRRLRRRLLRKRRQGTGKRHNPLSAVTPKRV